MNKKFLFGLLICVLVISGCGTKQTSTPVVQPPQPEATTAPATEAAPTADTSTTSDALTVNINGFKFESAELVVKVGDTVTWKNNGGAPHIIAADDNSFTSIKLNSGDTFSFTFTAAGEFTYHCGIHSSMVGKIIVQP